jgi:uncharacterized protein (DUF305 family)
MNQRKVRVLVLAAAMSPFVLGLLGADEHNQTDQKNSNPDWSELIASMERMHMAMGQVPRSGNSDIDFVRLMLPHHQAALDMAKTQLVYGKDPQMRRLAQEIITDQQLEIELMRVWLKQHESIPSEKDQTSAADTDKQLR